MRKSILFVIDSLNCAGAEKSLVTLLNLLDYKKYDVELQLFSYGGPLEKLLPKEVTLLPKMEYTRFTEKSLKNNILGIRKINDFKMIKSRILFSKAIRRKNLGNRERARLYWSINKSVINANEKIYDIAISYSQGIPTFYVAEKINATCKFAWVNVSYQLNDYEKNFQKNFYRKYNKIIAVSDSVQEIFVNTFPEFKNKLKVIYDINDYKFIKKMSREKCDMDEEFNGIKILTIGRLANQKGYDIALQACKSLKNEGIKFKWYCLGKGPLKDEVEEYIKVNNLEENFILLGVKENPYSYIRNCDIYVQTSRFEGFGLAIAEARMLNKPVVTTEFDSVYNQMINEKNGLVVKMNSNSVYEGVKRLIDDTELRNNIIRYLKEEKKGNTEELNKFYELLWS